METIRTDLAMESHERWRASAGETSSLPGVRAAEEPLGPFRLTTVEILTEEGAKELCKPIGRYLTLTLDALVRREEDAFEKAAACLAEILGRLLPDDPSASALVVGLGNREITPDALGPLAAEQILVTRHLRRQLPQQFGSLREVASLPTGVLGKTGIESADLIRCLTERLRPDCLLVLDALAAADHSRLCRTIQLSDAGIVPGSGVGNTRLALDSRTMGVPVISVGVPTVVSLSSLLLEYTDRLPEPEPALIVTPKDIDRDVQELARLLAYGIDLALHPGLTVRDLDMLVG